jgi:hypothetical protein
MLSFDIAECPKFRSRGNVFRILALIFLILFSSDIAVGATYYIDFSHGSNSNTGLSSSSAWRSHPYMKNNFACNGGVVPQYTHVQGDRFIFRGGSIWPSACFGMHIVAAGGTGGARDYYGLEAGFGSGLAVFDGGGKVPGSTVVNGNITYYSMVTADSNIGPFDFDGFEIKNWLGIYPEPFYTHFFGFQGGWNSGWIKNSKIHGWMPSSDWLDSSKMPSMGCVGQASADNVECWQFTKEELAAVGKTFSGINRRTGRCWGSLLGAGEIKNSKCHDVASGVDSMAGPIHDSEFYNLTNECCSNYAVDPNPMHTNVIQFQFPGGVAYNNLFHDIVSGQLIGSCSYNMKLYNNVFWNVTGGGGGVFMVDSRPGGGCYSSVRNPDDTVAWIYNNTGICSSVPCVRNFPNASAKIYVENNHWITDRPPVSTGVGDRPVIDGGHNKIQPIAAATDYSISTQLSPRSSAAPTIDIGANLSSECANGMQALCFDTKGAPWFGGASSKRPQGAFWDVGAYEYNALSTGSPPKPPSRLTVSPTVSP